MYATDKHKNLIGNNDIVVIKLNNQQIKAQVNKIDSNFVSFTTLKENKKIKISKSNCLKYVSVLTEQVSGPVNVSKSKLLNNLMTDTKQSSPLDESINSGISFKSLNQSIGISSKHGFKFGNSGEKIDMELKNRKLVLEALNNLHNVAKLYSDLDDIALFARKQANRMKQNLQEYNLKLRESLDPNMIMKGDLVSFGKQGKLYVNNPYHSLNEFSVTDSEKDRFNEHAEGWILNKKYAKRILESAISD